MSTTVTWAIDGDWAAFDSPWEYATFTWTAATGLTWEEATYDWETYPFRWDNTSAENAPAGRTMDIDAETRTYRVKAPN